MNHGNEQKTTIGSNGIPQRDRVQGRKEKPKRNQYRAAKEDAGRKAKSEGDKPCFSCGETKPMTDFYSHPMMADGRLNKCKECCKRQSKERQDHLTTTDIVWLEKQREAARLRARGKTKKWSNYTDEQKKKKLAWTRENRRATKNAHNIVRAAIRVGKISKSPCFCGDQSSFAHHEDYSKPLDVVWLCNTHHAQRHVEINKEKRAAKVISNLHPAD